MKTRELQINLIVAALIIIGIVTRFFIEIPNFTAIGAIALFSGAYLSNRKLAIFVPLFVLFVSDLFIGFHPTMAFVYIPFLAMIFIGFALRQSKKPAFIVGASIAGSILFYLVSNFGVWITHTGITPERGLLLTYVDALPFFRNMLAGDLVFNSIFFFSAYLIFEKSKVLSSINE